MSLSCLRKREISSKLSIVGLGLQICTFSPFFTGVGAYWDLVFEVIREEKTSKLVKYGVL